LWIVRLLVYHSCYHFQASACTRKCVNRFVDAFPNEEIGEPLFPITEQLPRFISPLFRFKRAIQTIR
jgi:hypothetical protein